MGACKLTVYDHENFGGDKQSFTSSALLHNNGDMGDRDASGRTTGNCQNTTFLGFEHWTNHDNGGLAWIMGEGDNNVRSFKEGNSHGKGKCANRDHRWYKRHDKLQEVVKIDIPTENINEGRLREDITIYGKRHDTRNCEWGHFPDIRRTGDGRYSANDSDQWLSGKDHKGQPCPGGDGYWKGFQKVSCVYKGADQIKALSQAVKDADANKDPRVSMYDKIAKKFCSKAENLNTIVTHDRKTCTDWDTSKSLAKEWCQRDDNIVDDTLNLCTTDHLGADMYNTLAEEYCKQNPDKDFCKCYNVVNYETVCANRGTSAGCPEAKEAYDKYVEFEIPDPNVWLPCGSACKGARNYKPSGYNAGCDGTIAACIQNVEVGASHDEINVACNIQANSGLTTGGSGDASGSSGSSGSGDASGSGGSSSVPLSTTQTSDLEKTVAEMKKEKEEEEEEDKKTKKKLLIGGGAGGIISSISFLMLIVLIIMTMSKKGGGRRR